MKLDGFFETSAKSGQNVETSFVDSATKLYRMNVSEEDQMMPTLKTKNGGSSASTSSGKSDKKEFTKLNVEKHDSKADSQHRKKKKG
mmetsp:Transcript_22082/g.24560  ORF Transcript_22082/g.24560 Transcript_22082/m.24560 type:complete len:87 (+) Transcript_22082:464-724(+)|eukprot:CAMPEP_0205808550 /NCGR_PEP_ID=MMETSP0205-20121125/12514_1 /ASSEMBLY_ACC=CAM_ASM_000278 /TAXON_ID=36767 /ORGANISM="Euplotes focardii, Strain TN1" /LENGTH=86 /DNA_ID=CAMNT_0053084361 /DNA_START=466 /DNA_END=726 /DNA_ORIENTATION=-